MAAHAFGYANLATPQQEDREALILRHLPQVRWIALRFHEKLPHSTDLDDLISVGIIGLIHAIDNFDPALNVKLKTYAELKIRGAILDSLRGMDGIAAHHRPKVKLIQRAIGAAEQRLHRVPTEEEVAAELAIPLEEYREWLTHVQGVTLARLEGGADGESGGILNILPDRSGTRPDEQQERAEIEALIRQAVERLPRNEQIVLDLYYTQELNLREIAQIMSLHLTRISQLKSQAVLRIRAHLRAVCPSLVPEE